MVLSWFILISCLIYVHLPCVPVTLHNSTPTLTFCTSGTLVYTTLSPAKPDWHKFFGTLRHHKYHQKQFSNLLEITKAGALSALMRIHSHRHAECLEELQLMVVWLTFWMIWQTIMWPLEGTHQLSPSDGQMINKSEKYSNEGNHKW